MLPKRVTVCGVSLKVEQVASLRDSNDDECYGSVNTEEGWLRVSTTLNTTPEQLERTFFHEYIHAVLELTGHTYLLKTVNDEYEEAFVRLLERMLFPLVDRAKLLGA